MLNAQLGLNIRLLGHLLTQQRVSRASQPTFAAAHLLSVDFNLSTVLAGPPEKAIGQGLAPGSSFQILAFWYGRWRVALAV
jgi:hypothetical protein